MAHLNGGPNDDQIMPVNHPELRVAGNLSIHLRVDEPPEALSIRVGAYRMRVDSLGQVVPHNMDGVVEFDWKGWS